MRLDAIRVRNFRALGDVRLDAIPARGLIGIAGPNESGKTALAEAVVFALHGRTFVNAPIAELIRWGESRLEVELELTTAAGRMRLLRELDGMGLHQVTLRGPGGIHAGHEAAARALKAAGIPAFEELRGLGYISAGLCGGEPALAMFRKACGEEALCAAADSLRGDIAGLEREYALTAAELARKRTQEERLRLASESCQEGMELVAKARAHADAAGDEARAAQETFRGAQKALDALRRLAGRLRSAQPSNPEALGAALETLPEAFEQGDLPGALEREVAAARGFLAEHAEALASARERCQAFDRALEARRAAEETAAEAIGARSRRRTASAVACAAAAVLAAAAVFGGWVLNVRGAAADVLVTTPALAVWGAGAGLLVLSVGAFASYLAQVTALGKLRARRANEGELSAELEKTAGALAEALEEARDLSRWPQVAGEVAPERAFQLGDPWQAVRRIGDLVQAEIRAAEERALKAERAHARAQEAVRKTRSQWDRAENELKERQASADKLQALAADRLRIERILEGVRERIETHMLAVELLESSAAALRVRAVPALARRMRGVMAALTGGKYREARLGDDLTPALFCGDKGDFLAPSELSGATASAARLSLAAAMASLGACARDGGGFIFFDHPLDEFDDARRAQALAALKGLEGIAQVFVLLPRAPDPAAFAALWRLENGVARRADAGEAAAPELAVRVLPPPMPPGTAAPCAGSAGWPLRRARRRWARRRARPWARARRGRRPGA